MWVRSEPAGYVRHITRDPLPGTNVKKILLTMAWLDKQVSNQTTEILARSLGIPNLDSSIQQGFPGIPDVSGPVDSAMVIYDTGSFDIFDVSYYLPHPSGPLIPPLANVIPSSNCDPHAARLGVEGPALGHGPGELGGRGGRRGRGGGRRLWRRLWPARCHPSPCR